MQLKSSSFRQNCSSLLPPVLPSITSAGCSLLHQPPKAPSCTTPQRQLFKLTFLHLLQAAETNALFMALSANIWELFIFFFTELDVKHAWSSWFWLIPQSSQRSWRTSRTQVLSVNTRGWLIKRLFFLSFRRDEATGTVSVSPCWIGTKTEVSFGSI